MPPPRRRRPKGILYAGIAAAVVLAAGGTAAYKLAGNTGSPPAAARPASCKQQYASWKTGSARADGKQLTADLAKVTKASDSEDIPELTSALKTAGADAGALQAYPMPACADPAGYWGQILSRLKAAGDNAGVSSGLGSLLAAEAPLQSVPGLESKLTAELKRTTGS